MSASVTESHRLFFRWTPQSPRVAEQCDVNLHSLTHPMDPSDGSPSYVFWHWSRTRDKASHNLIPIPLGYHSHTRYGTPSPNNYNTPTGGYRAWTNLMCINPSTRALSWDRTHDTLATSS
ncbi:hypothetical protein TNCV_3967271 [Trichonephila clavipes]|nr:hypothetical protein TNCV_3967271 [Trichonephila clavipes]